MIEFKDVETDEQTEELVVMVSVPVRHLAWFHSCVMRGAVAERDMDRPLARAFEGFADDMGVVFEQTLGALAERTEECAGCADVEEMAGLGWDDYSCRAHPSA